jgi:serine protease Do
MNLKNVLVVIGCSFLSAFLALKFNNSNTQETTFVVEKETITSAPGVRHVSYTHGESLTGFTHAASISTPTVVHVSSNYVVDNSKAKEFYGEDLFYWFFGPQQKQPKRSQASGSGVIISENGYIVTNHHVIENANKIEVTLNNNKKYVAEIVGVDKDTDIALLKIEEDNLPYAKFANSDDVLVGEWVLAVGNPFNLSSTVTAGIVSAKGRSINILSNYQGSSNTAIESFIQTDAAVNPGNSGGALVNTDGDLIGINTAIATPTGTYAGYSFAVPSNLVAKVVSDLKEYGSVQRGFLGVSIGDVNSEIAENFNLKEPKGVILHAVHPGGGAEKAGLKANDVIIAINGDPINKAPELQQKVAKFRPGNVIELSFVRNGETKTVKVELKNIDNSTEIVSKR